MTNKLAKTNATKLSVGANIHNRFDIYVKNIETGTEEQVGYAENIVLDQMYTRLCARSSYFVNIHFGTGTGTLSASRTSLFTHLGTKAVTNDAQSKALPTSWWRQKIVLNPEEYVGSALSEVGVAYGATSTNLVTHALIKDMNGNPITLLKTALDVVTIYATVYVTFSTNHANLQFTGMPNSNPLVNYLIGGTTFPLEYFYTGQSDVSGDVQRGGATLSNPMAASSALTLTADVLNKKFYSNAYRFGVDYSNGHIVEIGLGSSSTSGLFRLLLPATGIYSGLDIEGVSVGTGDGVESSFMLPSRNVDLSSIVAYIDGLETSITKNTYQKLSVIDMQSLGYYNTIGSPCGADMSDDGSSFIMSRVQDSPYVFSADFISGLWVARPTPSEVSSGVYRVCMSDNGSVIACGLYTTDQIYVFDYIDGIYIKRPTIPRTSGGAHVSMSGDGSTIVIVNSNQIAYIYTWVDNAWVENILASFSTAIEEFYMTKNGEHIVFSCNSTPNCRLYDLIDGVWTLRSPNPTVLAMPSDLVLSEDGIILATDEANSGGHAQKWEGSSWSSIPLSGLSGSSSDVSISKDGELIIFTTRTSPYVFVFMLVDDIYVLQTELSSGLSSGNSSGHIGLAKVSKNRFVCSEYQYQYNKTFNILMPYTEITFATPPADGAVITADYTVNGIHKTAQRVIDLYAEITFGEVT